MQAEQNEKSKYELEAEYMWEFSNLPYQLGLHCKTKEERKKRYEAFMKKHENIDKVSAMNAHLESLRQRYVEESI